MIVDWNQQERLHECNKDYCHKLKWISQGRLDFTTQDKVQLFKETNTTLFFNNCKTTAENWAKNWLAQVKLWIVLKLFLALLRHVGNRNFFVKYWEWTCGNNCQFVRWVCVGWHSETKLRKIVFCLLWSSIVDHIAIAKEYYSIKEHEDICLWLMYGHQ